MQDFNSTGQPPISPNPENQQIPYRRVTAARGVRWIAEASEMLAKQMGAWLGSALLMLIILVVLSLIPGLNLLTAIAMVIMTGGLMLGCRSLQQNQGFSVDYLFAGLKAHTRQLAMAGLLYQLVVLLIVLITFTVMDSLGVTAGLKKIEESMLAQQPVSPEEIAPLIQPLLLSLCVGLALFVPMLAAYWFVPPLITLHNMKAAEAFILSFKACMANIVPFLIYGLAWMAIFIIVIIALGIINIITAGLGGVLFLIPVYLMIYATTTITVFTSYTDIFAEAPKADGDTGEQVTTIEL